MNMKNPPHPGEVLRRNYMEPLELSVSETARRLRFTRQHISQLVRGNRAISINMALSIGKLTNTTPKSWLNMQTSYDLWQHRNDKIDVEPLLAAVAL